MKITEIDKNFDVKVELPDNAVWLDAKKAPFTICGLLPCESGKNFIRMPIETAKSISAGVADLNYHTAGGRIRFRTNASFIAIRAVMPDNAVMDHITMLGQAGFDLYGSDGGVYYYAGSFRPNNRNHGYIHRLDVDPHWHTYTINMPLYDPVEEVYIGLPADAEIEPAEPYAYEKPVLYYGSSITQGGCASRPGNAYQAMISRRFDCDFINLGFSGSARAEDEMISYLCSLDVSVFVCDYDHNAPSVDHLNATHKKLYCAYREANPETPIILVSKPDFRPERLDDVLRREVILATYHYALSRGDRNISFVDGAKLFEGDNACDCTVDGCHPNDLGFFRMAQKIGDAVGRVL